MTNNWKAEDSQPDVVSYWYFVASVATWFMTPVVFMIFSRFYQYDGTNWLNPKSSKAFQLQYVLREKCHPIIYYLIKALVYYFIFVIRVYIFVPVYDIYLGFENLFCHKRYKDSGTDIHAQAPALKIPEQLGEAIPQFAIAVVFFSKNAHWLRPWELILGGVTMTLSCGSILFGVVCGVRVLLQED